MIRRILAGAMSGLLLARVRRSVKQQQGFRVQRIVDKECPGLQFAIYFLRPVWRLSNVGSQSDESARVMATHNQGGHRGGKTDCFGMASIAVPGIKIERATYQEKGNGAEAS